MQKRVQRNRALNLAKKEPTLTPTILKASQVPTPDLFSADSVTGDIQNINIAFNQFKQRMTQIGNQYTGEKQEYFFEQLNQCEIDRFKALSTEKGRITISNVREAETILQSEFEGFHEPNSITRPTKAEFQEGNALDGRFRKGILSDESNTLNEEYTDVDAKLLVSDKTLQDQADQRRILGHKNPKQMDQLYDLAVKYRNNSMSREEFILELRGGGIEDWLAAFGIIIAIIAVLNNVEGGAIVTPHLQWLYGNQQPGNNFGYCKNSMRITSMTGATQNAGSEKKEPSKGSYDYVDVMKELDKQSSKNRIEIQAGDQIYMIKNPSC